MLAATLATIACSTSQQTQRLERALSRRAAEVPGFDAKAHVVAVPAASDQKGWQELVRITSEKPSAISLQLAEAFNETSGEPRHFVVGGPHAELTDRVLHDALVLTKARQLPGVRILVLSPEPPSVALDALAARLAVELVYRDWKPSLLDL